MYKFRSSHVVVQFKPFNNNFRVFFFILNSYDNFPNHMAVCQIPVPCTLYLGLSLRLCRWNAVFSSSELVNFMCVSIKCDHYLRGQWWNNRMKMEIEFLMKISKTAFFLIKINCSTWILLIVYGKHLGDRFRNF